MALVTGGSKGLGLARARALAEAGADIVISSRHEDELRKALDQILAGTGRRGAYVVADMSQRDDVRPLAQSALDKMGSVDVLVNNAGANAPQAIDQISDETWDNVMEINEFRALRRNEAILAAVYVEVDRVRAERGLPTNEEALRMQDNAD